MLVVVGWSLTAVTACGDPELDADTGGVVPGPDVSGQPDLGLADLPVDETFVPPDTGPDVSVDTGPEIIADPCLVPPFDFLCPCEFNNQCDSGYCIAVTDDIVDQRCTRQCDANCPEGYECKSIAGAGDPVFICVQIIDKLCDPCFANSDCLVPGDLCVQVESATYCARNCETEACPDGYTCSDIDGDLQCLPNSGSCACPPGVDLTSDPDHCGECGNECEFDNALAECVNSDCALGQCKLGFWDIDLDPSNGCEYACDQVADSDEPDPDQLDTNCDGIDGDINRAIFVAPYGDDNAAGTPDAPVQSVAVAISKTNPSSGVDHVYIAAGSYSGQVVLADGVSLFGGFSADGNWSRSLAAYESILLNETADASGAIRTLVGNQLTTPATIAALTIQSANNPSTSGSSYSVYLNAAGGALLFRDCRFIAGSGGPGSDGDDQPKAADGVIGQPGGTTDDTDCFCDEFDTYGGKGGAPGNGTCGGGAGAGGQGANSGCGDDNGSGGDDAPDGTAGGPKEMPGTDGDDGAPGDHGTAGVGGSVVNGLWSGAGGGSGSSGQLGEAGGGGGSGDGHPNGIIGCAVWGGGGGGGASAGCGGAGAEGGTAGGGSFAVFLVDSSPEIRDCELSPKNGGNGGNGGRGGDGGNGKTGGLGGGGHEGAGDGGKGGDSGSGGDGGNGGGGAGGPSFAVFLHGSSSPKCVGNTFLPLGVGGIGGVGGDLEGNAGAPGDYGSLNTAATPACDPENQ